MNIEYNGFIGIYNDVYPEGYCQHLINEFDRLERDSAGSNRWQSEKAPESRKNDYQISLDLRGHSTHDFQDKRRFYVYLSKQKLSVYFQNFLMKPNHQISLLQITY